MQYFFVSDYFSDEPECIAGSLWKDDCNLCTCAIGIAVCTNKPCTKAESKLKFLCS